MSIKDRILCAFGFHGKVERAGELTEADPKAPNGRATAGWLERCTVCNRLIARYL